VRHTAQASTRTTISLADGCGSTRVSIVKRRPGPASAIAFI
jgi:hypothetical protein